MLTSYGTQCIQFTIICCKSSNFPAYRQINPRLKNKKGRRSFTNTLEITKVPAGMNGLHVGSLSTQSDA